MNIELFNTLIAQGKPMQNLCEWKFFLEFIENYFKGRGIKNPVIVELGTYQNKQKKFYEQLLGARHIGIDIAGDSDIKGDTHRQETLEALKGLLAGKAINLLFIDGMHFYKDARADYNMYGSLTKNIIAFHDIDSYPRQENRIGKLWQEIMAKEKEYTTMTFRKWQDKFRFGIALLIKE